MYYNRKKYEKLIAESTLFSMDKESETSVYKRESYKMIEYLYCYLMAVSEKKYEPYACEIVKVSTRCITNFDCSMGCFLHYFNAAWKHEYSHLQVEQIVESKLRGIKVSEEEKRNVRKYLMIIERKTASLTKEESLKLVAEAMQMPIEKIQLIAALSSLRVIGDTIENDDGEEVSVWEQVSDGASIEDDLMAAASIEELLAKVEVVFASLQERQKPIISDMITGTILSILSAQQGHSYSFISDEVMEFYGKTGQAPTQRAIANKYGRDEASISRTAKEFIKKLKKSLRGV